MTADQLALIAQARARHGAISPCGSKRSLKDCFTQEQGLLMFWFNTPDGDTHMIRAVAVSTSFPRPPLLSS